MPRADNRVPGDVEFLANLTRIESIDDVSLVRGGDSVGGPGHAGNSAHSMFA